MASSNYQVSFEVNDTKIALNLASRKAALALAAELRANNFTVSVALVKEIE